MRLTCPNCDAQYEVPDEVVPTSGRDVQCSNCGQTWFQHHVDHVPPEEDENELTLDAPAPDEEVSPPPPPTPPPSKEPEPRQLDPAVADILRQEAEAEFEARKQRRSEPLESQPELGLDTSDVAEAPPMAEEEANTRALEAKKRMARMRGESESASEAAATAAAISSRRELLPDIEEINSTLRNDTPASGVDGDARDGIGAVSEQKQKRGFRWGFFSILLIAVLLILLYVYAAQIAQAVPALEDPLASYVAMVDRLRIALDVKVKAMLSWLDAKAADSGG